MTLATIFFPYLSILLFYPWPSIWRRSVHSILNPPPPFMISPRFFDTHVLPFSRAQIFVKTETVLLDFDKERTIFLTVSFACLRLLVTNIMNHNTRVQCTWWCFDTFLFSEDPDRKKWIRNIYFPSVTILRNNVILKWSY